MVPQTILAFVAFLLLVAPGLFFEILREKRRPTIEETAFREASRTAFTSLIFTGVALALLAALRLWRPDLLPDPGRWLREKGRYLEAHYRLIAAFAVVELLLALALALTADRLLRRRATGEIVPGGIWFQILRVDRPKNKVPWVSVQLTDKTQIAGFLNYYTAAEKLENREIALKGNVQGRGLKLKVGNSETRLDDWDTVVVRGDQIAYLKVMYLNAGRAEKESWWQRNLPPPSAVSPGPLPPAATKRAQGP